MLRPIECSCPECGKNLLIHSRFSGKLVRCNNCKAPFEVPESNESVVPDPPPDPIESAPKKKKKKREVVDHRGGTILTYGILSFFCFIIFGPLAWIKGNHDLKEMDEGRMDSAGRGLTRAGQILGLISIILFVLIGVFRLFFGGEESPRPQSRKSNETKNGLDDAEKMAKLKSENDNSNTNKKTENGNVVPNQVPPTEEKLVTVSHKLGYFSIQYDSALWNSTTLPSPVRGHQEMVLRLENKNIDAGARVFILKEEIASQNLQTGRKSVVFRDFPKAQFLREANFFINGREAFLWTYQTNDPQADVIFTILCYPGKKAFVEVRTVAGRSVYPNAKSQMEAFLATAKFDDN